MKLSVVAAGLSSIAIALVAASFAAAAPYQSGDSVVGAAVYEHDVLIESITVAAHSGPAGEEAHGHITFRANPSLFDVPVFGIDGTFHGDVSEGCLLVTGNRAVAVGKLPPEEQFNVPPPAPQPFLIQYIAVVVDDHGPPSGGQPADMVAPLFLKATSAQALCAGSQLVQPAPFEHGNFVVRDTVGV
jgi:hypothetical protein